jgi:hypothetical protein
MIKLVKMSLSLENGMLTFTSNVISNTTSSSVSSNFNDYVTTCDYVYTGYPLTVNSPYSAPTHAGWIDCSGGLIGVHGITEKTEAGPIKKYHIRHR